MRLRLAVALFSCALLIQEITLVRLFSVTMVYHFAFLVLSITLFGLAAGAMVHLISDRFRRDPEKWLPTLACAAAAALPLSLIAVLSLRFSPYDLDAPNLLRLALIVCLCIFPFLVGGLFLSLLYIWKRSQIGRLYGADLTGAAIGCAASVLLLQWIGAESMPWIASGIWLAVGLLTGGFRSIRTWVCAGVVAVTIAAGWTGEWLGIRYVKGREEGATEFQKWNVFSRVAVRDAGDRKVAHIDADAATEILSEAWLKERADSLLDQITGLVYRLRPGGRTLIIGPGGGREIAAALQADCREILGVEINPIIADDLMRGRYFDYSGRLYAQPGVSVVVSDARHFLETTNKRFDIVQANAVDTWAAAAGGGFTLAESYLYTVEAFELYFRRLEEDGVLTLGRWVFDRPQQMLRVAALALEAMERLHIEDPARRIFLLLDPSYRQEGVTPGVIFIKKQAFLPSELAVLREASQRFGYPVFYDPDVPIANAFNELIRTRDRMEFYSRYAFDVAPTSDDRPFFFFTLKWSHLGSLWTVPLESRKNNAGLFVLLAVLALMSVLTAGCFLLPLRLRKKRRPELREGGLFVLIGLGFMLVENALVQRSIIFLGHPSLTFAVVVGALLVGAGLGSRRTHAVGDERVLFGLRRGFLWLTGALVAAALAWPVWLGAGMSWPLIVRVGWLAVPVAAMGLVLGRMFPLAVRTVDEDELPWAWALNGSASVLGSILAVGLAMGVGFSGVLWIGSALYASAWLLTRTMR